jgi:hypothetical protein
MRARRIWVAVALTAVIASVIGLLYVQVNNESRATRAAWIITRDLAPGSLLDPTNVKQVRIAEGGDQFVVLQEQPYGKRLIHGMTAQSLLAPADVYSRDLTQVAVSLRAAPSVGPGDTIDVYAVMSSRTVLVGRSLVVIGAGNPVTVLVPAADEAAWITLQANNVPLYAAKGNGIGVPSTNSVAVNDAVATLSASAGAIPALPAGGPQSSPVAPGGASPRPTPR